MSAIKLSLVVLGLFVAQPALAVTIQNAITVPTDITKIIYPDSYSLASPTTVEVADPYCALTPSTISFPKSYLGSYPLPTVPSTRLSPTVRLGGALKDAWHVGNPSNDIGCSGDVRANFLRTLARLKTLGATWIELTPWTFVDASQPTWVILNPAQLNTSTMNDDDLAWAVTKAHNAGLQVHWFNQIQGATDGTIPEASVQNVTKFLAAFDVYMLERAALLERLGVDVMIIGCTCWFFPQGEIGDLYFNKLGDLAPRIKTVYRGKLRMGTSDQKMYSNAALYQALDYLEFNFLGIPLTASELDNLSVPLLKAKYADRIAGNANTAGLANTGANSKEIIWSLDPPSRHDYFTTGYVEETFCTSTTNTITQTGSDCIQRNMVTDFSFQAMVLEAELEAIRDQSYFKSYGIVTTNYWMTDAVLPDSTFPNLAVSMRNKPAEALLYQWFNRPGNPLASASPYDGIYQWDPGYYLSVHQIGGGTLIGTIYWVYTANTEQVGRRAVPDADTFDLSHGQLVGSTATMTGTRFYRGCTLSYDFTFNPDASLTVRLDSVSNSPGVSVADVDCAARYTPVGSVRTIPRIY